MELTNLLWHLGALIAALWAGFSYRTLLLRQQELESGVLASLLLPQADTADSQAARPSTRQLSLLRSARVRALGWFVDEFAHRHGCKLVWKDRELLIGLSDEHWRQAVSDLYERLLRPGRLLSSAQPCLLDWQRPDNAVGQWIVVSESGKD